MVENYEKILKKVQGLLAKAESTEFPEERATFLAKAEELMIRYQITQLDAANRGDKVIFTDKFMPLPNCTARTNRAILINDIAKLHGCSMVDYGESLRIFGTEADIQMVIMLWTHLEVQMQSGISEAAHNQGKRLTHAFKKSFIPGFCSTLGQRLTHAHATASKAAGVNSGTALVLRDRWKDADNYMRGEVRTRRSTARGAKITDTAAYTAGRAAGKTASMSGAGRKQINS